VYRDRFRAADCRNRNRNRAGACIHGANQTTYAPLLPILAVMLLLCVNVSALHYNDPDCSDGLRRISSLPANENAVAYLQIFQLHGNSGLQVRLTGSDANDLSCRLYAYGGAGSGISRNCDDVSVNRFNGANLLFNRGLRGGLLSLRQ